jgi:hypothetical protein
LPQPSTGTSALGRGRPGDRRYAFGGGWPGGPLFGRTAGIGGDYKVIGVRTGYEAGGWDPARRSLPPASPTHIDHHHDARTFYQLVTTPSTS